ncbi:hypothetical protein ACIRPT_37350 [Streptomyces sp. NPDC101227]
MLEPAGDVAGIVRAVGESQADRARNVLTERDPLREDTLCS